MKRGDIYLAVVPGDYGKTRPVVVVQNDIANATHSSCVVCPLTSHLMEAPLYRLTVAPAPMNGLEVSSQIMVDKIGVIKRERLRERIGHLDDATLVQLGRAIVFWLGV